MEESGAIKIARLEEQIKGLREQQNTNMSETRESLKNVSDEIKTLTATMNRGRGMFTASLLFAGGVGSFLSMVAEHIFRKVL